MTLVYEQTMQVVKNTTTSRTRAKRFSIKLIMLDQRIHMRLDVLRMDVLRESLN